MIRLHDEWLKDCEIRAAALHGGVEARKSIVDANVEMIQRAVAGQGPDNSVPDPDLGARMAVNIAAVHIPAFCDPTLGKNAYLNAYDTEALGAKPPSAIRKLVDATIAPLTGSPATEIYFGSVELNGAGIRFYGDVCLVLKGVPRDTVILTSNSYDLVRPPITPRDAPPDALTLEANAARMSGRWPNDIPQIVTLKVLALQLATERRLTTGQISEAILDDEDYLELLRIGTFDRSDLHEARLSAADVAAEIQILENSRLGPAPSMAELQWRKHRRSAASALAKHNVRLKVVATSGRAR